MNSDDNSAPATAARTGIITGACIFGALGAVLTVPIALSEQAKAIGGWYGSYLIGSALATAFCMIGLWKMRRWGIYLYAAVVITNQMVMLSADLWHFSQLAVPAIFAGLVLTQFNRMR